MCGVTRELRNLTCHVTDQRHFQLLHSPDPLQDPLSTASSMVLHVLLSTTSWCCRQEGNIAAPLGLDPKVVEVYTAVGKIMSRYTAGKVPKAFKVIPNLQNWEDILYLTDPEHWSPHAVYQATRLFISNLNARMVSTPPLLHLACEPVPPSPAVISMLCAIH